MKSVVTYKHKLPNSVFLKTNINFKLPYFLFQDATESQHFKEYFNKEHTGTHILFSEYFTCCVRKNY